MSLNDWRAFAAVARGGALSAAAVALHRTPSAISMALQRLESALGGPLFEGERKRQLTPLGRETLRHAERALAAEREAREAIARFARGEAGLVRVAAVPSAATTLLPAALARLLPGAAQCRYEISDSDSATVRARVLDGRAELGLASPGESPPALRSTLLRREPLVLLCPPSHSLCALERPIDWCDIPRGELIGNGFSAALEHSAALELHLSARLHCRNSAALLAAVARGLGVTLMPASAALDGRPLRALALADPAAQRELALMQAAQHSLSPAARALRAALIELARPPAS